MDMASSSTSPLITRPSTATSEVRQVNESLFELHKPDGIPKLQIVFFHGFQLEGYKDAHLSTWTSRDGCCLWPKTWLVEDFPDAHVLSVAYNASLPRGKKEVGMDLYIIAENIISDLCDENIGQDPRCPLILVGHSFGGILIKQLCIYAWDRGLPRHTNFLQNLKGVFFYSTPHHGAEFQKLAPWFIRRSPLLENVTVLSTSAARLHDSFQNHWKVHYRHWQVEGVGESQATQLPGPFAASIIVEESSTRYGDNYGTVVDADHMTVCRPKDKTSRAFTALTNLLSNICSNSKVFGPVHQCTGLPDHPSGLDERVTKAKRILAKTAVLGIVGMGGIGKSSIATQLYNDIGAQFEYTCFVENVKGISINDLEEKLLNAFYKNGIRAGKGNMEWYRLKAKKTLIVMDDVDKDEQLRKLPQLKNLGDGSQLVFTSRKHDIFNMFGRHVERYDVEILNDDEAKKLLCLHVFGSEKIPDDLMERHPFLEEHVNHVAKKCQGLPLTLEVIGCHLQPDYHEVRFWEESTRRLGEAMSISGDEDDRVWLSLKVSYDGLAQEEKDMFIRAATILYGKPVKDVLAACSTPKGGVHTTLNNLKNKSLVKLAPPSRRSLRLGGPRFSGELKVESMEIWVHEHLHDLARKISARDKREWQGFSFEKSISDDLISVEIKDSGMDVWSCTTQSSSSSEEMVQPVLQWHLSEDLGNLEYFSFSGNADEMSLPVSLEVREFTGQPPECFRLPEINWQGMKKLRVLHLNRGRLVADFWYTLGSLINLRVLSIERMAGLLLLPHDFGNLRCLKMLRLTSLNVRELPDSFGDLAAMECLRLEKLPFLLTLPETFGELRSLETLKLEDCTTLKELPASFGRLKALKTLKIYDAPCLKALPGSFGNLSSLTCLELDGCRSMDKLPESFGSLLFLEHFFLRRCDVLRKLPKSFSQLGRLKSLTITECRKLRGLCEQFGFLRRLEELYLHICSHLQRLPSSFGQLTTLKKLSIAFADELQELCDNFGRLSGLEELELDAGRVSKKPLKTLLNNLGGFKVLKKLKLTIRNDDELVTLCDNAGGQLSASETLEFTLELCYGYGDPNPILNRLPDNFGRLTTLTRLEIWFSDLEELPDCIGHIYSLRELSLKLCFRLRSLPDSLGKPQSPKLAVPRGDGASPSRIRAEGSGVLGNAIWHSINCDGCGLEPIEGWRYVSIKRESYDLCSNCFGKEVDKKDFLCCRQPPEPHSMRLTTEGCASLNHFVLTTSGWVIMFKEKAMIYFDDEFYQRIALDEDSPVH